MEEVMQEVRQWLAMYGINVLGAIVILVVGLIAAKFITKMTVRLMNRAKMDQTLVTFGGNIIKFLLMAFVIIAALSKVGVQTASLIAMLGAASLAVGLALQGQLSNLAAGVLLLINRPFRVGEMVDAGGVVGTVVGITILQTKLKGFDGTMIYLPNNSVFGGKIINYHDTPHRRVDLVFGIAYDDDVPQAKEIIMQAMTADSRVLKDPAPSVAVMELADSSVNLAARPWVKNADWWDVRCDLLEQVKARFDQAGISIPFPQRDVHLIGQGTAADTPGQQAA